jgi:hypothetical protein
MREGSESPQLKEEKLRLYGVVRPPLGRHRPCATSNNYTAHEGGAHRNRGDKRCTLLSRVVRTVKCPFSEAKS